jgi:hypothetical protein
MCLGRWAAPTGATEEAPLPVSVTPSGLGGCLGAGNRGLTPPAMVVSAFQAWGLDGISTGLGRVIVIRWAECWGSRRQLDGLARWTRRCSSTGKAR